jgi:hypothetical protein
LAAGDNRTYISVYTPLSLVSTTVDTASAPTESGRELGSRVYSRYVQLAPGASTELSLKLRGSEQLARGGWYELALPHQPQLEPTPTRLALTVADGWRFVNARGLHVGDGGRTATLDRAVDRSTRLRVRVVRDHGSGLWARLRRGADAA